MRELAQIIKELREKKGPQTAVAARLKVVTSQQLGSYERGDYKPKADFFEAWKREYGEDILAIQKGNNERNVSKGDENGTSVHIPKENNGNSMTPRETFYTDLIENNAEYSLLPRAVLQDYKIVPDKIIDVIIASTASEKKALEDSKRMEIEGLNQKYELIIAGLENKTERLEKRNKELEKENEDLRRQIPAQSKK